MQRAHRQHLAFLSIPAGVHGHAKHIYLTLCLFLTGTNPLQVRLRDSSSPCAGRVEVRYNSTWYSICDKSWSSLEAEVVCKQLGCGPAQAESAGTRVSQDQNYIFLEGLQCRGGESLLLECQQSKIGPGLCQHLVAASVVCTEPRGECIKPTSRGGGGEKPKGWMQPFHFKRRGIKVVAHPCQNKLFLGGHCLFSTNNEAKFHWLEHQRCFSDLRRSWFVQFPLAAQISQPSRTLWAPLTAFLK